MPIFDYKCDKCDREREYIVKYSDQSKQHCPNCNEPIMTRIDKLNTGIKARFYNKNPKKGGFYKPNYLDWRSA